jgi:phosphohistidine phosphatase SixA
MQRLILMRHAEAVGSALSGLDRDRPLSPYGRLEASAVGRALAARGLKPDLALVSAATRTRQTRSGTSSRFSARLIPFATHMAHMPARGRCMASRKNCAATLTR